MAADQAFMVSINLKAQQVKIDVDRDPYDLFS
jgi:hypothetical protein